MNTKRVIIAGGSGFMGRSLARHLREHGYEVNILTRSSSAGGSGDPGIQFIQWDGKTLGPWCDSLDGATAIVNLAGRSVNCRYNARNRAEIRESRVNSVNVLAEAIARSAHPPLAWVQAATLAVYGDAGERVLDESAAPATGFSPDTALMWENAFNGASIPTSTRRVLFRISFVLGRGGGPLQTLERLTRCFLGGAVASGRQYVSWIHQHDLNEMFRWAIERDDMSGMYHATAPNPVTNAELMRGLRRALHRPWSPPTPRWAVHIGACLMHTEAELALRGRYGVPARFDTLKFPFRFPDLDDALENLYPSHPVCLSARHP
jgi:uncharacterized protein (TIGR01777 family)